MSPHHLVKAGMSAQISPLGGKTDHNTSHDGAIKYVMHEWRWNRLVRDKEEGKSQAIQISIASKMRQQRDLPLVHMHIMQKNNISSLSHLFGKTFNKQCRRLLLELIRGRSNNYGCAPERLQVFQTPRAPVWDFEPIVARHVALVIWRFRLKQLEIRWFSSNPRVA